MSDELTTQLLALYRAGAAEEPDERMDAAILAAARRRRVPHLMFAIPTVLLLAVTMIALQSEKPVRSLPAPMNTGMRPGMADGREHLLAISAEPERIGMNLHPRIAGETSSVGEE
jgi:hypothetical protein